MKIKLSISVLDAKSMKTRLTELLQIKYPIIMAPMFLVYNVKMVLAAAENGITGCIPALNFRKED